MKNIIKRAVVLLVATCLVIQPAMAVDLDSNKWCPCLGRYDHIFRDQPYLLEALASGDITLLERTYYPEYYRQIYALITNVFGDMAEHPERYPAMERFYAIWTYLRGTTENTDVVWNEDVPSFMRPLLYKYGTYVGNVLAMNTLLKALGLDAPTDLRSNPMSNMVTIDGNDYHTDPLERDHKFFLLNDDDWADLGRTTYDAYVCDTPSVDYDDFTPATERKGAYTFLAGTGILVAWDAQSGETDLVIPEGTAMIADSVFEGNTAIRSVSFPEGFTDIGYHAFRGCEALETIELPDTLLCIGTEAFAHTGIRSVNIPASVTYGDGAFAGSALESVSFDSGSARVYPRMFESCTKLKAIDLPKSITHVGERAFAHCGALTEIDLSAYHCELGPYAFAGSGLVSMGLPAISVLQDGLFYDCTDLKVVQMQEGLLTLENVFGNCESLGEVTIPSTVIALEELAFLNADLTSCSETLVLRCGAGSAADCYAEIHGISVVEDASLESQYKPLIQNGLIGGGMQYQLDHQNRCAVLIACDKDNLKLTEDGTLEMPDMIRSGYRLYPVTEIAEGALANAPMKKIRMPSYLKTVGEEAFSGSALIEVDFSNCPFLERVPTRAYEYCQALTSVTLGDYIKTIGDWAFFCCTALTEFHSGEVLETIENSAFAQSALRTVVLGSKVRKIESGAFCNLEGDSKNGRTAIYFEGNAPELEENAMSGANAVMVLRRESAEGFDDEAYAEYATGVYIDESVVSLLDAITVYERNSDGTRTVHIQVFHREKTEEYRAFLATYDENGQMLDCAVGYLHAANAYVKGFIQKDMEISADATRLTVFLVRYQDGSNTPVTQSMAYDLSGI